MLKPLTTCVLLLLVACGQGGGGSASSSASAPGASSASSGAGAVRRCMTPAGLCYEYTGKKFRDEEAAAKRSCDTATGGKLEVGACPKQGMLGSCTRNIGQPGEYVMFVPAPATSDPARANFEAQQHCQTGSEELGVWEHLSAPAAASSASAGPSGAK